MCRALECEELGVEAEFATLPARLQNVDELVEILETEIAK